MRTFEFQDTQVDLPDRASDIQRTAWQNFSLNEPNLEVRLGAIYALERIAQDSIRDHIQIVEILCAYVRQNSPCRELLPPEVSENRVIPRIDIQTAITVLGRRPRVGIDLENRFKKRLDLRNCDLSGINFELSEFSGTLFNQSKLEGAVLNKARMLGSDLRRTNLRFATFWETDLTGARLDDAIISPSNKFNSLNRAKLTGSCLFGTDLTGVYMQTAFRKFPTIGNRDTLFSGFTSDVLDEIFERLSKIQFVDSMEDLRNRKQLDVHGLNYWSPFTNEDMANGQVLDEAHADLALTGWLYEQS